MNSPNASRYKKLQKLFAHWRVDGCLIENPIDLLYLTGLSLSLGMLVVTKKGAKLFVDGRYFQAAKENSGLPVYNYDLKKVSAFLKKEKILSLGFDSATTSYKRFLALKKEFPLKAIDSPLQTIRLQKEPEELAALHASAKLLWKAFLKIPSFLKEGITEKEVAKRFEIFCLQQGAEKLAFEPIIAFGAHSALPHHHCSEKKLRKGDTVLIDIGVVVDNYHSDMTRVLFFGKPSPKMEKIYQVVFESQQAALSLCKPGVTLGELDKAARSVMAKANMEKAYLHSLGHGVGLEIHEFPRISATGADRDLPLTEGMVITIEPGLYFSGMGGVRYEDTIVITATGYKCLYPRTPLAKALALCHC